MSITNALIIFIRNPRRGSGKTRIAEEVGEERAFRIYLELLDETKKLADAYTGPRYLYYSEFPDHHDAWDSLAYRKRNQAAGDLGQRMAHAFEEVLLDEAGALIMGSDCPTLSLSDLEEANRLLHAHDVVIGPARDGGYYLLGMKAFHPFLFDKIPWSSPDTCQKTIKKAERNGLRVARLRMLNDIDTYSDWLGWKGRG